MPDQKRKQITRNTKGRKKIARSLKKEAVIDGKVILENTEVDPVATSLVGMAALQVIEGNVINITRKILAYEEEAKLMKEKISRLEEQGKEKQPRSSELEEFKDYLETNCRLNVVYLCFYLEIQRIQIHVPTFNGYLERGKTMKGGMEAMLETIKELFHWQRLYKDALDDFPKMHNLDQESNWNACEKSDEALIHKASNVVEIFS